MAVSGNTQQSIRKALGVLKDSTMVGLAKVNSDYKGLDIAIVKATNHVEVIPKEKHVRKIFNAISASRPRADVAYCINSLARRLAKTSNWAVALKTLVVIHRALREVDPSFREELMKYRSARPKTLNLSHFKDDSSTPENHRTGNERIARAIARSAKPSFKTCQLPGPEKAAIHNNLIRFALSMVVHESIKIYAAVSAGTHNLADQFFDMERHDAIRALGIYRKAGFQAGSLNEFYKICKRLDFGRPDDFKKVEQPPESFLTAMEEYIKNTSHQNMGENGREILAIEYRKSNEDNEEAEITLEPSKSPVSSPVPPPVADLLCLDDFLAQEETVNVTEEQNPLALALVSNDNVTNQGGVSASGNAMEDWELALVSEPVSNQAPVTEIKLVK
ncbi:hypothetical protein LUZ60_017216 [Juncus effusus]|nr:hypothetical protein LUZ60_017216 [Juncus effusus]